MRAVIYSRVSTSDKGQKPEIQIEQLKRYCDVRGWTIAAEISDEGFSGGTVKRPGLAELLALARTRGVDSVVVVKLDRLARSLKHLISLMDEFSLLGVQFVSINDQIDLTTASGRLMAQMIGAFAEFERALVRERTIAGLNHARSLGKRLGRPKTADNAGIVKARAAGKSYTEIQKQFNVSRASIRRAIVADAGSKTSYFASVKR